MTGPGFYQPPTPDHRRRNILITAAAVIAAPAFIIGAVSAVLSGNDPAGRHAGATPAAASSPATATAHRAGRPAGRASFTASVVKPTPYADPTYPGTLDLFFTVTNTSRVPGTPVCTITASSPDGRHHGTDVLDEMDRVGPGQTTAMAAMVQVSHGHASLVTMVDVRCS